MGRGCYPFPGELSLIISQSAVSSLTDPSITDVNFTPQILSVIANLVSPPQHACSLIHNFFTLTGLELESSREKDIKLLGICSASSLSQAFGWIRTRGSSDDRMRMREEVWFWALGVPRSPCGAGPHGVQRKAMKELLHLPLRPEENAHLVRFLSHPPRSLSSPARSLLHDLVTLRLIHQGQYAESLQLDKQLTESGGNEDDRQRRREMVREFIAILPESQRRALLVESEAIAARKDQERGKLTNGYTGPPLEDYEMGGSWIDVDGPVQPEIEAEPAEPMSIRPYMSIPEAAQAVPLPTSPAPQLGAQNNSPFGGPPRFANSPASTPSMARVLSGSPFAPPRNATASSSQRSVPKQPKQILNDDEGPVEESIRRSIRGRPRPIEALMEINEDEEEKQQNQKPSPASRRSNRRIASGTAKAPPKELTPPPTEPATSRTRQSTAPPSMPGAFASEPESVLDNEDAIPPPRRASSAMPESRSRLTRNATKATLDDEEGPTPLAKRTKSNIGTRGRKGRSSVTASEVTDEGTAAVRRSTRRAGTVQPSENGSPTPSITPSVSARSDAGGQRRVKGNQTPRMKTRSRRG